MTDAETWRAFRGQDTALLQFMLAFRSTGPRKRGRGVTRPIEIEAIPPMR